jgi:CHAT domain-containing protein
VAESYNGLANIYWEENHPELALEQNRHATQILTRHLDAEATQRLSGDSMEEKHFRGAFVLGVALDYDTMVAVPKRRDELVEESFRMAQLAQSSSAASALAGMAARFAAGSDGLAKAVRERQDLLDQWNKLNTAMIQTMGRPSEQRKGDAEAVLRQDLDAVAQQLAELDRRIGREFPAYAELSNPQPMTVAAAQALLADDEALLVYVVGGKVSWLWTLRRHQIGFTALDINARDLLIAVRALRVTLDPQLNQNFHAYPASDAYALYKRILAPATPLLEGAHHVLIVPDGALQSLPVGVLVTKPPAHDPDKLEENRDIAWFARDHAITVLPAVSTLRALRQFAVASKASAPFLGIGDPVLKGDGGATRGVANLAAVMHGGMADVDKLRALPPLPETADELRTVATMLGAPSSALYLGQRASEPLLAKVELSNYRVIEFATHGLVSGEMSGLAEPALVLTPPDKASRENDGLLTASKIAKLKLDADWVVLSACNTAAGDGSPSAEGLSGLAKAFFYAGSRAMLVSNWPIASKAAVKLTTGIFDALKKDPSIGRAEALRRSEMAMLDDQSLPAAFAHPMIWAPFTLAGEGGAKR